MVLYACRMPGSIANQKKDKGDLTCISQTMLYTQKIWSL